MSHFTVLVIGNDPEKLLAPFDESIEVEPYEDEELNPQDAVDWAKKVLANEDGVRDRMNRFDAEHGASYKRIAGLDVSTQAEAEEALIWYGDGRFTRRADGTYVRMTTYNPDSKWDWYSLGGRWRGSLKVTDEAWARMTAKGKPGLGEKSWVFEPQWNRGDVHTDTPGWVDQCRKADLDLDGMVKKKVDAAEKAVAALMDFIAEHGMPPSTEWLDVGLEGDVLKAARDAYWNHPWMEANKKLAREDRDSKATVGAFGYWDLDDLRLVTENADGRDRFLELQAQRAIPGFAFLDEEHGWVEPGRMGWWGMSSDTAESRAKYYEERLAVLMAAPDDVLVSVYDCHI